MRFGLNYISYVYEPNRVEIVKRSLITLGRTRTEGLEIPVLRVSYKPSGFDYSSFASALHQRFTTGFKPDPPAYPNSMVHAAQDSAIRLLDENPDVTHICHLCDDRIFHPDWLIQLKGLIERHPGARAWSVYRSAYTEFHRVIRDDGMDCLMTMHDAIGCTTREEWYGFMQQQGYVSCPDIHHAAMRPGEFWATGSDFMENIGLHGPLDHAIKFMGES